MLTRLVNFLSSSFSFFFFFFSCYLFLLFDSDNSGGDWINKFSIEARQILRTILSSFWTMIALNYKFLILSLSLSLYKTRAADPRVDFQRNSFARIRGNRLSAFPWLNFDLSVGKKSPSRGWTFVQNESYDPSGTYPGMKKTFVS